MVDISSILARHAATVAAAFDELMRSQSAAPAKLIEAIRYSFDAGGKRLRPVLVLETFDAVFREPNPPPPGPRGGPPPLPSQRASFRKGAIAAALAIELIHTFSLVHDDLPAMDDDDLRRGRPTNHKVFGEAVAILAGDAMMTLAFEALVLAAPADRVARLAVELARATGPAGMIGGQVMDMDGQGKTLDLAGLAAIHRGKTGALLTAACRLGAIAATGGAGGADAATLAAVTAYGHHLGLAFQITDDILDETATPEQLGKATHKDAGRGKNTYPGLIGLEASKQAAAGQVNAAISALAPLGGRGERLIALARFVSDRGH